MKAPLWLKRFPLVGPLFWDRGAYMVRLNNGREYIVHGLSTVIGFGPEGQYTEITDASGDVVRKRGQGAR